ncbi:MAG: DUF4282 domain-containing protein [Prochloraceae cyanobacterium]
MERKKSFFQSLFDFSFSSFITLKIIGILYGILIGLFALGTIASIFGGFSLGFFSGVRSLILAPLGFLLSIILLRIGLETMIVLFKVAEHTAAIANNTKEIQASKM